VKLGSLVEKFEIVLSLEVDFYRQQHRVWLVETFGYLLFALGGSQDFTDPYSETICSQQFRSFTFGFETSFDSETY